MVYEMMLREFSLFGPEKRLLTGDLNVIFHYLNGAIEKVEPDFSQRQAHSRSSNHDHKLQQGKFRLDITIFFTVTVVEYWKTLPRESVYPLSLEIFQGPE